MRWSFEQEVWVIVQPNTGVIPWFILTHFSVPIGDTLDLLTQSLPAWSWRCGHSKYPKTTFPNLHGIYGSGSKLDSLIRFQVLRFEKQKWYRAYFSISYFLLVTQLLKYEISLLVALTVHSPATVECQKQTVIQWLLLDLRSKSLIIAVIVCCPDLPGFSAAVAAVIVVLCWFQHSFL